MPTVRFCFFGGSAGAGCAPLSATAGGGATGGTGGGVAPEICGGTFPAGCWLPLSGELYAGASSVLFDAAPCPPPGCPCCPWRLRKYGFSGMLACGAAAWIPIMPGATCCANALVGAALGGRCDPTGGCGGTEGLGGIPGAIGGADCGGSPSASGFDSPVFDVEESGVPESGVPQVGAAVQSATGTYSGLCGSAAG